MLTGIMKAPKVLNPRRNQLRKLCNTSVPVRLKSIIYVGYQMNDKKTWTSWSADT